MERQIRRREFMGLRSKRLVLPRPVRRRPAVRASHPAESYDAVGRIVVRWPRESLRLDYAGVPRSQAGVDIDHIAPAVRGFTGSTAAVPIMSAHGLEIVGNNAGWIRDPDRVMYQLSDTSPARVPVGPQFAQVLMKAGERLGTAFVPLAIRDITLRVAALNRTGDFLATVFGGEVKPDSAATGRSFTFGRSEIRLIPRTSGMPNDVSLDHLTIATKDFNVDAARRALEQRGIQSQNDGRGGVVFADPDGIQVHLA